MPVIYCPNCEKEVFPYLKTGELKEVKHNTNEIVSYQLYFCVHCKAVLYVEHEKYSFLPLAKPKPKKKGGGKSV